MPTDLDRSIHEALADLVAAAPTIDDVDLDQPAVITIAPARARRWPLAVAAATVAALGLGAVAFWPDAGPATTLTTTPPTPVQGATVGRYFVPTNLPDGHVLLGIEEHGPLPDAPPSPARALYVDEASDARVMLHAETPEGHWSTWDEELELTDGAVRWGGQIDASSPVNFQLSLGDALIGGELAGVAEDDLPAMFESIGLDDQGVPSLDRPGFTLLAAEPEDARQLVAGATLYFGSPGPYSAAFYTMVRIDRWSEPIDEQLEAGVWDETVTEGDRSIHLGMFGLLPWWTPAPDLTVSVVTSGISLPAIEIVAQLEEIDAAELDAAIAEIGGADDVGDQTVEVAELADDTQVEVVGADNLLRGACLTVEGQRRCDLTMTTRGSFTADERLLAGASDLLIDGHWYTVGFASGPVVSGDDDVETVAIETVVIDDRTWYLIRHPDDALVSDVGPLGSRARPGR